MAPGGGGVRPSQPLGGEPGPELGWHSHETPVGRLHGGLGPAHKGGGARGAVRHGQHHAEQSDGDANGPQRQLAPGPWAFALALRHKL